MEYQINDRLSFLRFLGLNLSTDVPDRNTIWLFREKLINAKAVEQLFAKFDNFLEKQGVIAHEGSIVDATFLEVPRQRNNREDNATIKSGSIPDDWKDNPNKLCQKDTDARWTKKNEKKHYGYKNHIKVDKKSKIIISYKTTNASVHDSQALFDLLDEKDSNNELFADSAYSGKPIEELLSTQNIKNQINEKGYRGHPLTEEQTKENLKKSKVRARVEHIFGFIKNSMKGSESRLIGFRRNEAIVGLMNLTYNICRSIQLTRV